MIANEFLVQFFFIGKTRGRMLFKNNTIYTFNFVNTEKQQKTVFKEGEKNSDLRMLKALMAQD